MLQQKFATQQADKLEWLLLGVYALCNSEDGDPTMFLQLAISREGIIARSFANTTNIENPSVQGGADRESTRLAVTIGDMNDVQDAVFRLVEKGWSLAALGDELGVNAETVMRWKAGSHYPVNSRPVILALERLMLRRRIPKRRRYKKNPDSGEPGAVKANTQKGMAG